MEKLRAMADGLRSYWQNLTERERRMLVALGGVFAVLLVVVPVYLLGRSIAELQEENERLGSALRLISRSRGEIAAMRAERNAREARYAQGAPGETWLPSKVAEQELSFSRVQHEPDRVVGGFRIHTTRASFQNTGLRSAILLLSELKNDPHPVAIERIHIDHHGQGDRYNVEIGVLTFERQDDREAPAEPAARGRNTARRAGS